MPSTGRAGLIGTGRQAQRWIYTSEIQTLTFWAKLPRPSASTLALEKRTNPFLLCETLAAFQKLKRDWPAFKKQHGLK